MRSSFIKIFFLMLLILASAVGAADNKQGARKQTQAGEARTALVIGNGAYREGALKNPVNDAEAMAAVLRESGFEVTIKTNAKQREMEEAIGDFGKKLTRGGTGLFYYAGHGMQVGGNNYLVPVDAKIESESDVKFVTVDAGRVLGKMEDAGNGMNVVILDACRNNPFARSFRSQSTGLAKMDAPHGSIIVYATSPGSVAADGDGSNGVYTKHLVATMRQPGLKIEDVLKRVRISVSVETEKKQVPWESSSLTGDFYFSTTPSGGQITTPAPIQQQSSPPVAAALGTNDGELAYWKSVEESQEAAGYELYLKEYPAGKFAQLAKLKIKQLAVKGVYGTAPRQEAAASPSTPSGPALQSGKRSDTATDIEFVSVPGGCFQMGDNFGDGFPNEKPVHEVCVGNFAIGKFEVAQGQWEKVMGTNPSKFKGSQNPVEQVSWDDTQSFIQKLNQQTGKSYRLPTEAEWEYACRSGGKNEKYCGGDNLDSLAWHETNSGQTTHPVGQKQANGLGLYDMSGNVFEWCADRFEETYYASSPRQNPPGPSSGEGRVFRGDGWGGDPGCARSAFRGRSSPDDRDRFGLLGFRLVSPPGQQ